MKVDIIFFRSLLPLDVSLNVVINILNFLGYESFLLNKQHVIIIIPVNRQHFNFNIQSILNEIFFDFIKVHKKVFKMNKNYSFLKFFFINNTIFHKNKTYCFFFMKNIRLNEFKKNILRNNLLNINIDIYKDFFLNLINYLYYFYGCFFYIFSLKSYYLLNSINIRIKKNFFYDFTTYFIKKDFFFTLIVSIKKKIYTIYLGMYDSNFYPLIEKNETNLNLVLFGFNLNFNYIYLMKNAFNFSLLTNIVDKKSYTFFCGNFSILNKSNFLKISDFLIKFFFLNKKKKFNFYKKFYSNCYLYVFIYLKIETFKKFLGFFLNISFIKNCLNLLQLTYIETNIGFLIKNKTNKLYLSNESSLIDEILRYYGIHNIKLKVPNLLFNLNKMLKNNFFFFEIKKYEIKNKISKYFFSRGFNEAINYSFINKYYAKLFFCNTKYFSLLKLCNPISLNFNFMRPSLLCYLVININDNYNNELKNLLKFFEIGKCFFKCKKTKKIFEIEELSIIFCGKLYNSFLDRIFNYKNNLFTFYELKNEVLNFFSFFNIQNFVDFFIIETKFTNIFSSYKIRLYGKTVGLFGLLYKKIININSNIFKNKNLAFLSLSLTSFFYKICERSYINKNIIFDIFYTSFKRDISFCCHYTINEREIYFCLNNLNILFLNKFCIQEMFLDKYTQKDIFIKLTLFFCIPKNANINLEIKEIIFIILNYLYRIFIIMFRF